MTVPNNKIKQSFACNGSTVAFAFTNISYYLAADLDVLIASAAGVETVLTQNTDYTVTPAGTTLPYTAGTITLIGAYAVTPPATGNTLVVYRDVPYTQEIDLSTGGAMPAATLEEGYDRGVMQLQQLHDLLGRTVTLPISSTASGLSLPAPVALNFLRWNAGATALENMAISSAGLLAVSAFVQTLLDDADAGAFLATLGLDADLLTLSLPASTVISSFAQTLLDDTDAATARATLGVVSEDQPDLSANLALAASVGSKALTVALKTKAGTDPSASDKVRISFRSSTITSGVYNVREVTGALSFVLSSGSTLGFTSALAGRIYVWAIDNAGTVELALSRAADVFTDENLVTTTAEGGSGGADSATTMYSATSRSSVPCRCLGYIDITTGATAGEWDNAPTKVQIMGSGVYRTGQIVQVQHAVVSSLISGSTAIPQDDTIPQNTEGFEVITCSITPKSAANQLLVVANISLTNYTTNASNTVALFQDSTVNALAAVKASAQVSSTGPSSLIHKMAAGTTGTTTLKIRVGPATSETHYVNSITTSRGYGGVASTTLTIYEIAT